MNALEPGHRSALDVGHPPGRGFGAGLVLLGLGGLVSAFALTVERFHLLEDPSYTPACDLNPVLSCGSVMVTAQASALGFPNSLIGLVGFSVVITIGVMLVARVDLPRWVLGGLALGATVAVVGVHWLIFQSLYEINALCPWCMVVWAVTIAIAPWSVLQAAGGADGVRPVGTLWSARHLLVMFWYLTIAVLILVRFWDYWRTLL